jgi:hypothetical protein
VAANPTDRAGIYDEAAQSGLLWFQLRDGRFEQIPGPGSSESTRLRPWTVQERVADLSELGGQLYLAVNGYGVAGLILGQDGFPHFQPFYDPLLFRSRTFTRILPYERSLLCHVYFNRLLNDTAAEKLALRGISLLELFPSDGIYRHRTPPFQRRNHDWECVGFAPTGRREAILAWKHSDPQETRFAYTLLDLEAGAERTTEQANYRAALAYGPIDDSTDRGLKALAREAARRLGSSSSATGLQFLVRGENRALQQRYEILPPEFHAVAEISLLILPVEHRGGRYTLLAPDGVLLRAREGTARVTAERLPPLPEGFVYTDLLISEHMLVAAWEQRAFTDVGAAGLFLWKDPKLSP